MAYWVRSDWTGKGMATKSAKLVAQYGFEKLGLNRVEIVAAQANLASIRVAEKTGAKSFLSIRFHIKQIYLTFIGKILSDTAQGVQVSYELFCSDYGTK